MFHAQHAPQHNGELFKLRPLSRLLPSCRAPHVRHAHSCRARVHPADVLVNDLRLVPSRLNSLRIADQRRHSASSSSAGYSHSFEATGLGNSSRLRPAKMSAMRLTKSSCSKPFVASVSRLSSCHSRPCMSLTLPPASSTSNTPAAVSQGFRLNSQNASSRPLATEAKSSAAAPALRTPCVFSVIW